MQAHSDNEPIYCEECGDSFTMHCTYCHRDNRDHFKRTCNYWRHDVKSSGGDRGGSSCGRRRWRGRRAQRGRGGSSRGRSSRGGRNHGS
eukprot:3076014-Rhodomonas_salina.3